jgi:hypothetical protein
MSTAHSRLWHRSFYTAEAGLVRPRREDNNDSRIFSGGSADENPQIRHPGLRRTRSRRAAGAPRPQRRCRYDHSRHLQRRDHLAARRSWRMQRAWRNRQDSNGWRWGRDDSGIASGDCDTANSLCAGGRGCVRCNEHLWFRYLQRRHDFAPWRPRCLQRPWRSQQDRFSDWCRGHPHGTGELRRATNELGRVRGRCQYRWHGQHVWCRHL